MVSVQYMGDCQNHGPFSGPSYNTGPNTGPNLGDPKRDHNFDDPPHVCKLTGSQKRRACLGSEKSMESDRG